METIEKTRHFLNSLFVSVGYWLSVWFCMTKLFSGKWLCKSIVYHNVVSNYVIVYLYRLYTAVHVLHLFHKYVYFAFNKPKYKYLPFFHPKLKSSRSQNFIKKKDDLHGYRLIKFRFSLPFFGVFFLWINVYLVYKLKNITSLIKLNVCTLYHFCARQNVFKWNEAL